jgi:hypothetical protein
MRSATCLALLACLVAGGGCLSFYDPLNLEGSFHGHQRSFSADLRWGQWEDAAEYVEPSRRAEFDALARKLADFRVTDYEVRDVQLDAERTSATAIVQFLGYEASMPIEREVIVMQRWRFDEQDRRWYVTPDADLAGKLGSAGFRAGPAATR